MINETLFKAQKSIISLPNPRGFNSFSIQIPILPSENCIFQFYSTKKDTIKSSNFTNQKYDPEIFYGNLLKNKEFSKIRLENSEIENLKENMRFLSKIKFVNVFPIKTLDSLITDFKHDSEMKLKINDLKSKGFLCIRLIGRNENSYFKAIGYAYIEFIIKKGLKYLENFINLYFFDSTIFYIRLSESLDEIDLQIFCGENPEYIKTLINGLQPIINLLKTSSMRKSLEYFFLIVNSDTNFDTVFLKCTIKFRQ